MENMEIDLQEFGNNQINSEYVYNKLVDLERRSRICNIRIDGVTEREDETLEQYEDKIQNSLASKTLT